MGYREAAGLLNIATQYQTGKNEGLQRLLDQQDQEAMRELRKAETDRLRAQIDKWKEDQAWEKTKAEQEKLQKDIERRTKYWSELETLRTKSPAEFVAALETGDIEEIPERWRPYVKDVVGKKIDPTQLPQMSPKEIADIVTQLGGAYGGAGAEKAWPNLFPPGQMPQYPAPGQITLEEQRDVLAQAQDVQKRMDTIRDDILGFIVNKKFDPATAEQLGHALWQQYISTGALPANTPEPDWATSVEYTTPEDRARLAMAGAGVDIDWYNAYLRATGVAGEMPPGGEIPGPPVPVNPFALVPSGGGMPPLPGVGGMGPLPTRRTPATVGPPIGSGAGIKTGATYKGKGYTPPPGWTEARLPTLSAKQRQQAAQVGFSNKAMLYGPIEVLANLKSASETSEWADKEWEAERKKNQKISAKYKHAGIPYQGENFGANPADIEELVMRFQEEIRSGTSEADLRKLLLAAFRATPGIPESRIKLAMAKLMNTFYYRHPGMYKGYGAK